MSALPPDTSTDGRTVAEAISRVLGDMVHRAPETFGDNARLFADLGLNSSDVLDLLMRLERELKVRFDVDALEPRHLETVGTLAEYLSHAVGG